MNVQSRRSFLKSTAGVAGGAWIPYTALPAAALFDGPALAAQIDAGRIGAPISKYLYGMFIEHAGNIIYRCLWSELVEDRKFYYAINSAPDPTPPPGPQVQPSRVRVRRWYPVGPDRAIVMDKDKPFVGEQSPRIDLDASTAHGIRQSGIGLRKGIVYNGRIHLKAAPGTKIAVTLVWGPNAGDKQTTTINTGHTAYSEFPLKFTPAAETLDGHLEITGTGTGSFHVGALSLMPADNVHGFRADTTKLLRDLDSGMYRLPGGNFLSGHDWRNAVGHPDKRPPIFDLHWKAMQSNDVGTDELMTLCRLLDVDPYITVNAGLGDDHSAAELVEYANGSIHTPQGALRAANGHPEPYHVKYWNVGNEPYGWWQIGHTALRFYVEKHNDFARSMRKVDPSITIIASGAMPDEMTVTGNARLATGKVQAEFGTEGDWTGGLFANCMDNLDGVSEHWYAHDGKRFDPTVGKDDPFKNGTTIQPTQYGFVPVQEPMMEWVRRPSNRVRCKAEAWAEYQKRFPQIIEKKVFLSLDEWSYGRPSLRIMLSYGMVMHEMFRHSDYMKMAAFTFGTSCVDFDSNSAVLNSHGLMFKFYPYDFGTLPVEVSGNSSQPDPRYPVGGDQPRVNAGSATYPLDMVAALTPDRKSLTVAVVNATDKAQPLSLNIRGVSLRGKSRVFELTGPTVDAVNHVGQKPTVEVVETALPDVPATLSVSPISISIYEFPVA